MAGGDEADFVAGNRAHFLRVAIGQKAAGEEIADGAGLGDIRRREPAGVEGNAANFHDAKRLS